LCRDTLSFPNLLNSRNQSANERVPSNIKTFCVINRDFVGATGVSTGLPAEDPH